MRKINTNVRDVACDTYYFLINFLILALLLVGELSTLTLSFNSPTIIPITLFTLLRSKSGSIDLQGENKINSLKLILQKIFLKS